MRARAVGLDVCASLLFFFDGPTRTSGPNEEIITAPGGHTR